jgi:hypothetical protein
VGLRDETHHDLSAGTPGRWTPSLIGAAPFLATDDAHHRTGTYLAAAGGHNLVGA